MESFQFSRSDKCHISRDQSLRLWRKRVKWQWVEWFCNKMRVKKWKAKLYFIFRIQICYFECVMCKLLLYNSVLCYKFSCISFFILSHGQDLRSLIPESSTPSPNSPRFFPSSVLPPSTARPVRMGRAARWKYGELSSTAFTLTWNYGAQISWPYRRP